MSCANSQAELRHDLNQSKRDKMVDLALPAIKDRQYWLMVVSLGQASDIGKEAIGGESFEDADYPVIAAFLDSVRNARTEQIAEEHRASLGQYIINRIEDHMLSSFEERAQQEVLES